MKSKKIIGAALAAMLCITPVTQAAAAVTEPYGIVSPLYEIAHSAQAELGINGSTATCKSFADSNGAVTITAEQYLQKQGFLWIWSTYDGAEWTKTVNANVITISNTKSGLTSGKYRVKTVLTFTDKNGKSETITVYSNEKSVG